ncbi:MAG: pseudouridine synthase [Bacillota bacterium]|nr:pseudouridine synthase [Bacillota bacterium]
MQERLQKYMARCGIASRRKCEELIVRGKVMINGVTVTELGAKVTLSTDVVSVDGADIYPEERKVYIALNKPTGYVTSVKDQFNRPTVIDLIELSERIYPIGRLDYDTSGLLLLTNDGEIYNKVIHPRGVINKAYIAVIKGILNEMKIKTFKNGVDIGGYVTAQADIKILKQFKDSTEVRITIHEGKNRQIRKMCDKIGNPVVELKRISVGKINLGDLKPGTWRNLTEEEVNYLKNL